MCKKRIEKAAFSVKAVKYASWDIPSGQLSLIYNGLKTNTETIEKQSLSLVGHDTEHTTFPVIRFTDQFLLLVVSMFGKGKNQTWSND